MTKNIMIVGVGGQGSLLASKLLGHLLLSEGYDVKVSEVHGMSQRGGSVVTYVRFGEKVYSPIIDKGEADFIVSFEKLEAARYVEYLRPDGKLLGHLLLSEGYDVKVSEVHGMSQRGGSVVTYVRFGDKVYSPIIDKGEADFIVSFEKLEAARYVEYLRPEGRIVVNTQEIDPMPVITGAAQYPENLIEKMEALGIKVDAMDCLSLAEEAGSSKAVNIVLMGRLSKYFDIPVEKWQKAIEECVPAKFVELNHKAFALGRGEE